MRPIDHAPFDRALLSSEHRAIMAVAGTLLAAVEDRPIDVGAVSGLRWRLAHLLARHLAREDRCVYPLLSRHADAAIALTAAQFAQEMGGLSDAYRDYMERWGAETIAADPDGFAGETRAVLGALSRRVSREELELYPRLHD